ncbi:multisubunit sodium/proton antiporter, MrpE subunit (TC 2.A.63.1) [Modicisalibacter ilicicola DSM 19980]|uniref:Multisubunit sodium/proton antiporter, MrpE subunit (TC 2.A.63.1) n=1 Tax=Modicisalibacter ilicicola DSM 19980 TaxID=1121942 RepID=A0A1M4UH86_9GAMM|nr:Na+/H+ antiporter subunit E [Halomonas ilicicola]SHE56116.1 multisubunit sodium/proton antiporter, MrpE subunit (TC 2.A.63.1) [Halomonas ilicicola DSM 19980]
MIGAACNLLLGFAWIVLTGDFSGRNLLAGLFFGYLALALIQSQVPVLDGYAQRLPLVIRFIGFFIKELVMANFQVSYDIVTPPWHMKPGVIAMPLKAQTEFEITFVANLISLTPGTLSLDVSDDRRVLYIHAMFLHDEAEVRRSLAKLEHRALELFH